MTVTPESLRELAGKYHEYQSGNARHAAIEELVAALRQAADRIEALEVEVRRLREALHIFVTITREVRDE